jgi:hypothetical protein
MNAQYLAKFFLSHNAFCDHDAKLTPQVSDDILTFAGDPMDVDSFIVSLRWSMSEKGFQFLLIDATNCTLFGPTGALKIGDIIDWEPNHFDGDKIRFSLKTA